MNLFQPTTFTWWQIGVLNCAVLCIGIAIGAKWAVVFTVYIAPLVVVGLALSLYLSLVCMKNK